MGSNLNFKNLGMGNSTLARQSSVYSLTLDEFQTSMGGIGKDFGSMNMDELLKSIWTAEENQNTGSAAAAALQRQSSLTLPRTLSHKTVDQVWKDVSKDYVGGNDGSSSFGGFNLPREPTLGEVTLEEFLVRAGVAREDPGKGNNVGIFGDLGNVVEASGFGYRPDNSNPIGIQSGNRQARLLPKQPNLGYVPPPMAIPVMSNNAVANGGLGMVSLTGNGVAVPTGSPAISSDGLSKSNGETSSVSPLPYVFNGGLRGRRSVALEKVVERRQRRMIKNRESAARSRARKQAYTMELEAEVAKLKEENEELMKKQAKMMEMQKNEVVEMANQQQNRSKRQCLRRMQTSPW